jgi:hypothetical protein
VCVALNEVKAAIGAAGALALWEAGGFGQNRKLKAWVKPDDRTEDGFLAFVVKQDVEWLFPLMEARKFLNSSLEAGTPAAEISAWLKGNVDSAMLMSTAGARMVMRAILSRFYTPKIQSIEDYSSIASTLYGQDTDSELKQQQQLQILYEVQLFCHEQGFPKGLLPKIFQDVYEEDIVMEEIFTSWVDSTDESTPSKGKAVMQANPFLQWLEEAESDDDSD